MLNRRQFVTAAAGLAAANAATARDIRWAISGYMWQKEVEQGIKDTARFGFHGIEPFRQHILSYLDKPQALKDQLDAAGISLVTCSNGGGMATNFIDPAKVPQSIDDHFRFARDFISHFGCKHFKINLGGRPQTGITREHVSTLSKALTELGKRTAGIGISLAPHPHAWGAIERRPEVYQMLEETDPKYVGLVPDTAHLTLGGADPVAIVRDHFDRVAALHFKDTPPRFRGHTGAPPSREVHRKENLYKNLGSGGVDFPAIMKVLRSRGYKGWITLDLDPPRPGTGTIEDNVMVNRRYLENTLKVTL